MPFIITTEDLIKAEHEQRHAARRPRLAPVGPGGSKMYTATFTRFEEGTSEVKGTPYREMFFEITHPEWVTTDGKESHEDDPDAFYMGGYLLRERMYLTEPAMWKVRIMMSGFHPHLAALGKESGEIDELLPLCVGQTVHIEVRPSKPHERVVWDDDTQSEKTVSTRYDEVVRTAPLPS